ncbi:MAG: zf-HC2 domain-containing protein [Acidobacteriota bacterium]
MSLKNPLRASLQEISEVGRGPHADPEQLLAYHLGELDLATAEAVEQHIALCSECSQHVLDMARFLEGDLTANAERGDELDVGRLMRSVNEALAADHVAETVTEEKEAPPSPRPREIGASTIPFLTTLSFARAAAVIFAVTTAALAGYLVSSRGGATAGLGSVMANVPVFELTKSETRGPGERDSVQLPGDSPAALLVFPLAMDHVFACFELTVETSSGEIVSRRSDLRRTAGGLLTLVVPRDFLPSGSYQVTIHGLDEGAAPRSLTDFELDWQSD